MLNLPFLPSKNTVGKLPHDVFFSPQPSNPHAANIAVPISACSLQATPRTLPNNQFRDSFTVQMAPDCFPTPRARYDMTRPLTNDDFCHRLRLRVLPNSMFTRVRSLQAPLGRCVTIIDCLSTQVLRFTMLAGSVTRKIHPASKKILGPWEIVAATATGAPLWGRARR